MREPAPRPFEGLISDAKVRPKGRAEPHIFRELPGLRALPWMPLVHAPTAVEPCDAIADWLGRDGVFMKRDDLASPLYGGNKVRRYEFVLADLFAQGKKRIVTAGGIASTQAMATSLFGHALQLPVRIIHFGQPITRFARNAILTNVSAGAELVWGGNYLTAIWRTWRSMSKESYLILPGAANALANLGYIDAMLELGEQVARGEMPKPDAIVLPTGSSGTLAALALGASWLGWDTEIIGVRIAPPYACNRFTIGAIVRHTDRFLARHDPKWTRRSHRVNYSLYGGALGPGYGYPTPEAIEAIPQLTRLTSEEGEVTYSGKALAALRTLGQSERWKNKTLLLWNTLSTPRPKIDPTAIERVPAPLRFVFERPCVA